MQLKLIFGDFFAPRSEGQVMRQRLEAIVAFFVLAAYAYYFSWAKLDANSWRTTIIGDSSFYLQMFDSWRAGTFSKEVFRYGPGPMLLGLIFGTVHGNPFVVYSVILFGITYATLFWAMRAYTGMIPAAIAIIAVINTSPIVPYFLQNPYSNSISAALIVVICTMMLNKRSYGPIPILGLGFLFGANFAARYSDAVLLAVGIIYLIMREFMGDRQRGIKAALCFAATSLPWAIVTFYLHHKYLGSVLTTPYHDHIPYIHRLAQSPSEDISSHFTSHFFTNVPASFYQLWIDPLAYALPSDIAGHLPVIELMPFLLLAPVGLALALTTKGTRLATAGMIGLIAIWFSFYCSFWPVTAHDFKYFCLRYFGGWYEIFSLFALVAICKTVEAGLGLIRTRKLTPQTRSLGWSIGFGLAVIACLRLIAPIEAAMIAFRQVPQSKFRLVSSFGEPNLATDELAKTALKSANPVESGAHVTLESVSDVLELSELRFDAQDEAENGFPWRVSVESSENGIDYRPVAGVRTARMNHNWRILFDRTQLRTIRVSVIESRPGFFWSINDFKALR